MFDRGGAAHFCSAFILRAHAAKPQRGGLAAAVRGGAGDHAHCGGDAHAIPGGANAYAYPNPSNFGL